MLRRHINCCNYSFNLSTYLIVIPPLVLYLPEYIMDQNPCSLLCLSILVLTERLRILCWLARSIVFIEALHFTNLQIKGFGSVYHDSCDVKSKSFLGQRRTVHLI